MPVCKSGAQVLSGDELKSMEKHQNAKGKNGIVVPGLKLLKEQMEWWLDARFGMFIHWGLYAIEGKGEWVMHNRKIPAEEYAKLADKFNLQYFNADK